MTTLPTTQELTELRKQYHDHVRTYVEGRGQKFIDMAISVPGARYILEQVEKVAANKRANAPVREPIHFSILDCGMGFSTMFLLPWARAQKDLRAAYHPYDHDADWMSMILLHAEDLISDVRVQVKPERNITLLGDTKFDVILVDHGPSLDARSEHTPGLTRSLAPGGVMLFDDWRPKHEGRIRRALDKVGGQKVWHIGDGGDALRRFPGDKSIGWARRR